MMLGSKGFLTPDAYGLLCISCSRNPKNIQNPPWSSVSDKRFIRCYSLEGRVLGESTGHNIYDLENEFKPEDAAKIELS